MRTVSMHEAKTHLSRLVKDEFIITNNGEPVARVVPIAGSRRNRFGFLPVTLARDVRIPTDFDAMGAEKIDELFGLDE